MLDVKANFVFHLHVFYVSLSLDSLVPFASWWNLCTQSLINPSVSHCAQSGQNFFAAWFFSWSWWSKMGKARKGTTARKQTKAARREKQVSKRKHGSFKWTDKLKRDNNYYGPLRNWVRLTFSIDNNSNILMLIKIIFDWTIRKPFKSNITAIFNLSDEQTSSHSFMQNGKNSFVFFMADSTETLSLICWGKACGIR